MKKLLSLLLVTMSFVAMAQQNPPQPIDPNVKKGVLDNGLTYYIRHNKLPEERADFYIAQKVGSMQEDDNQAGLAHFLEHMAFNGTTNYPGKTMLEYLQENGIKFGTNINAYTSFDETVYYVSKVPTTNQNLVDSVLLVLYDWSSGIALEESELDSERGVIREEWRTRGGAQQRLWDKLLPAMYPDSKYAKRMPIGDIDVINNFKPEEIRSYYKKWYRPDLQGIIIVGDFDAEEMEQKVIDLFSKIPAAPADAEPRHYYPVEDNDEPIITVATDPESTNTQLMIFYKHEPTPEEIKLSQAGLILDYLTSVASSMMNERFQEILQKPNAPFTSAYAYDGNYFVAKTKDAWTVVGSSAEDKIEEAVASMIRESERVKRFGFTASEYDRARTNLMKSYEDAFNNRDKQRDDTYAQEYVRNFTENEAMPGIEYEYNMINMIAPNIPVEAVNQVIEQLINDNNMVVAITGPEKEGLVYPEPSDILSVIEKVKTENIEAYEEEVSDEPLITTLPTAGIISSTSKDEELGATVLNLQNGMKVILKHTDFKNDQILMTASSNGGYSSFAEKDPLNSKIMPSIITLGGVGNFSSTGLNKALAGKTATVRPTISLTTQGFTGSSSIKDFETMLQLVYLYFTSPRSDNDAFESFIQRLESQLKNQEVDPMTAFSDAITEGIYGDNPLTKRLTIDDLSKINYSSIMDMYKQQFSNAGDFIFTFVGNINEEEAKPLIEQYLASLPGKDIDSDFTKVDMSFKAGKSENIFQREMQNPKASVFIATSGNLERTQKNNLLMSMLGQVLDIVYTEKVREDEGGTYGVSSRGAISRYPEGQAVLQIMYETDPAKMEDLNTIIFRELKSIADNGPRAEDFSKVKEYMLKQQTENLKENGYWLGILSNKYVYGEDDYSNYSEVLKSITAKDIQDFTKQLLSQDNQATIVMMPVE